MARRKGKTVKTSRQITKAWQDGMSAPQTAQNYRDGINATTDNPMQLAATPEALQSYQNACTRSVTSGRRAEALNAVPVARWKQNASTVGAQNLSQGAIKAQDKMNQAMDKWAPIYAQASAAAAAVEGPKSMATAQAKWLASTTVLMQAAGKM